jgi:hypothetical protein
VPENVAIIALNGTRVTCVCQSVALRVCLARLLHISSHRLLPCEQSKHCYLSAQHERKAIVLRIRRIVVPCDFNRFSDAAIGTTIEEAKRRRWV